MDLPEFFIQKMRENFPLEADSYFNSLKNPPYAGLRVNTLKISPDDFAVLINNKAHFALEDKINWCDEGFYCAANSRPAKSPFYHAGLFYIQEPSAMSAASVFEVSPGDKVLDICAAPGGKTTHLAAKLNGSGLIVANDISNTRCRALVKNLELAGVTNAVVLNETPEKLAARFAGFFDKILIDAPCSGEGMFRKDPDAVKNYTKYKSEQLGCVQKNILRCADIMLKDGGEIMYSTCTFSPDENERIIGGFLSSHDEYELKEIDKNNGFCDGNPGFYPPDISGALSKTARLWPQKIKGEGHFLAWMKHRGICVKNQFEDAPLEAAKRGKTADGIKCRNEVNLNTASKNKNPANINTAAFKDFCAENLENLGAGFASKLVFHGESLYSVPDGLPDLSGIRIIRTGFYLGEAKKGRFEPSQALAMGLSIKNAKRSVNFQHSDENLYRYLKGESFEVNLADGFCLVCLCNYPLGFGKVQNGRLKNKYLKSWIMN
ncbi:MAG: RsmB/NOP family class I SAM-dependent RNA methyltransferase [Clostridiales bacterium]|nr:RsmB/NOP family class I SAM-dependent RNA methyltransferase [Clostridiales bacterium]